MHYSERLNHWIVVGALLLTLAVSIQSSRAQTFITNFTVAVTGTRTVQFAANVNSYYILYSGSVVTNVNQPIAIALGSPGELQFQDAAPQLDAQFYRVAEIPQSQPLDSDGDGIDDLFELSYPGCLNPLDPLDASADCDGDGRSNLQEYYAGTNPGLADAPPRLVINEVDYDQVGTDTGEFVELLNTGTNTIRLGFYALAFINGANNLEYLRYNLSGTLGGGQYLVVASTNLTASIASGARALYFNLGSDNIQNGAPDGIALVNHGSVTVMDGFPGTRTLVEGTALSATVADSNTVVGSLARLPDGMDTDNAANDWSLSNNPTPGSQNVP